MSTSVPQIQFTDAGLIIPTDAAILAGTQADMNAAFGGGLNPQLSAPQGQLASSQAAIVSAKDGEIAYLVNQFDPQYADGRFQDGLARVYFLTRNPAASTAVTCTLGGLPSTVIPAGTLAYDTSDNTYVLLGTVSIGSGSTVSSSWQNQTSGPIPCPAGTLTIVGQAINGWDSITNPSDGTLGNVVESRADFEFRRQNSVAINSNGTVPAIYANVFEVENVLDVFVYDNATGGTVDYGSTNYPLAPHSIYVAVVGGDDQDVANAIWGKKDSGASYSAWPNPPGGPTVPGDGSVSSQTVLDTTYSYPQPAYNISFIRPGSLAVYFAVEIANTPNLPSNIVTLMQNAVLAQFNGQNGNERARIGSTILAAQYYAPVAAIGSFLTLLSVAVGLSASPSGDEAVVGVDQTPTLNAGDIAVTLV